MLTRNSQDQMARRWMKLTPKIVHRRPFESSGVMVLGTLRLLLSHNCASVAFTKPTCHFLTILACRISQVYYPGFPFSQRTSNLVKCDKWADVRGFGRDWGGAEVERRWVSAAELSWKAGRARSAPMADTASGPQPPDRRQLDAGSAIGVKVARLRSQKRKFRLSVRGGNVGAKKVAHLTGHQFAARQRYRRTVVAPQGFRYRLTMPTVKHDGPREIEDERNPGASGPCGARNRGCLPYLQLRRVYGSRARSRNIRTKPMPSWLACAKSTVS